MAKKKDRGASEAAAPTAVAQKSQGKTTLRRVLTRSDGFVSIYTNDIQVTSSPWDVRMVLGEIGDQSGPGVVTITQVGEIRMSPQLAKKLTLILIEQLKSYEEHFGEIPVPRER